MSIIEQGRRRLNAPPADLTRESNGTRALAKRRVPLYRVQPLARTATVARLRTRQAPLTGSYTEETVWADAEAGPGRTKAKVTL
jgi:hypothetical protein